MTAPENEKNTRRASTVRRGIRAIGSIPLPLLLLLALASATLLIAIAVGDGVEGAYDETVIEVGPHLTLEATPIDSARRELLVDYDDSAGAAVELVKHVERGDHPRIRNAMTYARGIEELFGKKVTAVSPFFETGALASFGASQVPVTVRGIIPDRELRLKDLADHLVSGETRRLSAAWNGAMLGSRIAAELRAGTGDRIRLISRSGEVVPLQVAGVFSLGVDEYDRTMLVNLRLAQALEHALPGEATGIDLQMADRAAAGSMAAELRSLTGRRTVTWDRMHVGFHAALLTMRMVLIGGAALLLVAAALLIRYWLIASRLGIRRRGRGIPRGEAVRRGAVGGITAGVLGIVLGVAALMALQGIPGGARALGLDGFTLSHLPVLVTPLAIGVTLLGATLAGVLAPLGAGLPSSSDRMDGAPSAPPDADRTPSPGTALSD